MKNGLKSLSKFSKGARGFSLVETVLYAALLSVLMLAMVNMLLIMARTYGSLKVSQAINGSAVSGLDRMIREIRNANDVNANGSIFDSNPGALSLASTDDAGNPETVKFYSDNGVLKLDVNGVYKGPLSLPGAQITNLVFRQINAGVSKAVKIELTLFGTVAAVSKSVNFYSTAVLRGSY